MGWVFKNIFGPMWAIFGRLSSKRANFWCLSHCRLPKKSARWLNAGPVPALSQYVSSSEFIHMQITIPVLYYAWYFFVSDSTYFLHHLRFLDRQNVMPVSWFYPRHLVWFCEKNPFIPSFWIFVSFLFLWARGRKNFFMWSDIYL